MILYQGPSEIDGKPIIAIMTGFNSKSQNSKTGEMPQVWIIRDGIHPVDALRTGQDDSICGDCIHRPKYLGDDALRKWSRTCYVNTMALSQVYKSYLANTYELVDLDELAVKLSGLNIRLGAYGDPAAVPIHIWDKLCAHCKSTGYTHQWKRCDSRYAEYCMASCDSILDVVQSTAKGYRVYFVQTDSQVKQVSDIKLAWCPASKEMGRVTTCSKCMACSGTRSNLHSNISIMLH